jgi:hypothetical protein
MAYENGNVVSILEVKRRRARDHRAKIFDFAQAIIWEAECDCFRLFGAFVDEIAHLSTNLVEHFDDIGDPADARYSHVLPDMTHEDLANFAISVATDVLAETRANDLGFDRKKVWGKCIRRARRLVTTSEYLDDF